MFLVDTTVWIDFFNGRDCPTVGYLCSALEREKNISICGPIFTESLQGIKFKKQFKAVRQLFGRLIYLPISEKSYLHAAEIYRNARSAGHTVRKTIDCFIASCAIEHSVPLLHSDKDYDVIAKYSKLKLIKV